MKKIVMPITGHHEVYGVIGDPITHTLSPVIHNALAKALEREAIYVPFHVKATQLEEAIKGAHALHIKGLNVTMPHKQTLFKYVNEVDESAQKVGAINTLVYTEKGYKGYNTDYIGLRDLFKENGIEWKDKKVGIIGSGGAAYAAYVSVADEAEQIHIFNRTVANADILKQHMQKYFNTPTWTYSEESICPVTLDLVIQTTGIGMGTYIDQMPSCTKSILQGANTAVDLIYHPKETKFLQYAKTQEIKTVNGFSMLFYQAVSAFSLMYGMSCKEADILNIKREILEYLED